MSTSCGRIAALLVKIQSEFLNRSDLRMTLPEVQRRFGADETACRGILGALVDARVLARTPDGAYVRFFPGRSVRAGADVAARRRGPGTAAPHPVADFAA